MPSASTSIDSNVAISSASFCSERLSVRSVDSSSRGVNW